MLFWVDNVLFFKKKNVAVNVFMWLPMTFLFWSLQSFVAMSLNPESLLTTSSKNRFLFCFVLFFKRYALIKTFKSSAIMRRRRRTPDFVPQMKKLVYKAFNVDVTGRRAGLLSYDCTLNKHNAKRVAQNTCSPGCFCSSCDFLHRCETGSRDESTTNISPRTRGRRFSACFMLINK